MSESKYRSLFATHSCRVHGIVHRFNLAAFGGEPKWSGARCLLSVRVSSDAGDNDAVVHLLVRAGAGSAEVLSLLHDALVVHLGDGGRMANTAQVEPRTA